jgi:hypothetical protein
MINCEFTIYSKSKYTIFGFYITQILNLIFQNDTNLDENYQLIQQITLELKPDLHEYKLIYELTTSPI